MHAASPCLLRVLVVHAACNPPPPPEHRHGLRFASTKASAAEASAGGLGIGAKLGLLVGCLGGGGLAFAASQGKTPMEVWEQTIDFFDLVPVEIPETLQHIEQPQIVTPDKHVHPYAAKPWYWKV